MLYCTVCDNNNGNCTIHNTTKELDVKHQRARVQAQAVRAGSVQPLLPLRSRPVHPLRPLRRSLPERAGERDPHHRLGERPSPRPLGWRRTRSTAPVASPAATASPSAPAMRSWKNRMLGEAGYLTDLPPKALDDMIDVVKGIEPPIGYGPILALSEIEVGDARAAHQTHQDRLHLLRRRLHLRGLDPRPPHPQDRADARTRQRHLHLRQRQVRLGPHQLRRPPDQAARSARRRDLPRDRLGRGARHHRRELHAESKQSTAPTLSPSSPLRSAPTKRAS